MLNNEPDLLVISEEADNPVDLLVAIGDHDIDVLVMRSDSLPQLLGLCTHLLAEDPNLIIIIMSLRNDGYVLQRRVQSRSIGNLSPETLIRAIREALAE